MSEEQHHAKKQPKVTPAIDISRQNPARTKEQHLHWSFPIPHQTPYCYIYRVGFLHFRNAEGKKITHEQVKNSDCFNFELTAFSSTEFTQYLPERHKKINLKWVNCLIDKITSVFLWLLLTPPHSRNGGSNKNQTQL